MDGRQADGETDGVSVGDVTEYKVDSCLSLEIFSPFVARAKFVPSSWLSQWRGK